MADAKANPIKVIATNRAASHDYHLHERVEAGLVLLGSEVKSLREAKATLTDGWAEIRGGEAWLVGLQINEYKWANRYNHDPRRMRKLLLNKQEIKRLFEKTQIRGYTLIPLQLYFKGARVKVELALVTNKKEYDKRQSKRAADDKREIDRAISERKRKHG